jgi:hypothetical protein
VANAVLIALTLLVIVFAKQTVTESRNATTAMRNTVSALESLLVVARDTAASSEAAAAAALRPSRRQGLRVQLMSVTIRCGGSAYHQAG